MKKAFELFNEILSGNYKSDSDLQNSDWTIISERCKLSEEFIEAYEDKVDWNSVFYYQKLSLQFLIKHKERFNPRVLPGSHFSTDLINIFENTKLFGGKQVGFDIINYCSNFCMSGCMENCNEYMCPFFKYRGKTL